MQTEHARAPAAGEGGRGTATEEALLAAFSIGAAEARRASERTD